MPSLTHAMLFFVICGTQKEEFQVFFTNLVFQRESELKNHFNNVEFFDICICSFSRCFYP